jgi:hypothetical protein
VCAGYRFGWSGGPGFTQLKALKPRILKRRRLGGPTRGALLAKSRRREAHRFQRSLYSFSLLPWHLFGRLIVSLETALEASENTRPMKLGAL